MKNTFNVFFICEHITKITILVTYLINSTTMKKIVTLCFFALTVCFSTQTMNAQNVIEINAAANQKANELRKAIKFDTNVLEEVYQAYKAYETKIQSIDKYMEQSSQESVKAKADTKEILNARLKELFTEEQFTKYESLED